MRLSDVPAYRDEDGTWFYVLDNTEGPRSDIVGAGGVDIDTNTALGTSDVVVPSQKAVKTYTDAQIAALPDLASSDATLLGVSTAGGTTTLDVSGVQYRVQSVRATSDQSVNNSTTAVNHNELVLPVVANALYKMSLILIAQSATAADMNLQWSGPTSATMDWFLNGPQVGLASGGTSGTFEHYPRGISTTGCVLGGATSQPTMHCSHGVLQTSSTAGNLQFKFAQNVADPSNCTVKTGSTLILERIG